MAVEREGGEGGGEETGRERREKRGEEGNTVEQGGENWSFGMFAQ